MALALRITFRRYSHFELKKFCILILFFTYPVQNRRKSRKQNKALKIRNKNKPTSYQKGNKLVPYMSKQIEMLNIQIRLGQLSLKIHYAEFNLTVKTRRQNFR